MAAAIQEINGAVKDISAIPKLDEWLSNARERAAMEQALQVAKLQVSSLVISNIDQ